MLINVVTAKNGVGLEKDGEILAVELKRRGHRVFISDHQKPIIDDLGFDLNIFMEILEPRFFPAAKQNCLVPNPEFFWDSQLPLLKNIDLVLCKTRHAERIFSALAKTCYLGWRSVDRFMPGVPRKRQFIHVAGTSTLKNTDVVLATWRHFGVVEPLIVVSQKPKPMNTAPNVTWLGRQSEAELSRLMNESVFHLCPSQAEGWGHYLHEALSCNARVLTLDAPPMSEFACDIWVEPTRAWRSNLAMAYTTDAKGLHAGIEALRKLHDNSEPPQSRARFENEVASFRAALDDIFGPAVD